MSKSFFVITQVVSVIVLIYALRHPLPQSNPITTTVVQEGTEITCYATSAYFDETKMKAVTTLRSMPCTPTIISDNNAVQLEIVTPL